MFNRWLSLLSVSQVYREGKLGRLDTTSQCLQPYIVDRPEPRRDVLRHEVLCDILQTTLFLWASRYDKTADSCPDLSYRVK